MRRARSMPTDYRIFVGAFPGGELGAQLQATRLEIDPKTAQITPPHVTLAGTYWRQGPAIPETETETVTQLVNLSSRLGPFDLVLGGVRSFPTRNKPVIYLDVEKTPELLAVRRALLEVIGPDKHTSFNPHLTLAMRLAQPTAQETLEALRLSGWARQTWVARIASLQLMQRGPADPAWRVIARFPLQAG